MPNHSHDYTAEWQHYITTDASHSDYEVHSSSPPSLGVPTLPHPPPQNSTTTYPPPHQESTPSNANKQSPGHQSQVPKTLVFPPSQHMPVRQNAHYPTMDKSSYATMDKTSFPTMRMPGYSPYGSSVTSASSSVSGFGSSVQEYQTSSNPQYSNEYNCPTLLTVPAGYAGVFSPGTGQTSQANEFSGVPVQPNTYNYGAGYYIPGYYGWN